VRHRSLTRCLALPDEVPGAAVSRSIGGPTLGSRKQDVAPQQSGRQQTMLCEDLNSAHRVSRLLEIGTFMRTEAALMIPPGAVLIFADSLA